MALKRLAIMCGVYGALFGACGGGDSEEQQSDNGGPSTVNAAQRCTAVANGLCTGLADCYIEQGDIARYERSSFISDCTDELTDSLGCSYASSVGSGYTSCLRAVTSLDCDDLTSESPLPRECYGVIED